MLEMFVLPTYNNVFRLEEKKSVCTKNEKDM